jgi:hypothetical protein
VEGDTQGVCKNFLKVDEFSGESGVFDGVPEWSSYPCVLGGEEVDFNIHAAFPGVRVTKAPKSTDVERVFFVACDYIYYDLYMESLCRSINLYSLDSLIHIHVIDSPSQSLIVENNTFDNVEFSFSNCSYKNKKQYYAVSRFLLLPKILNIYKGKTVIILDADVLVNKDIGKYLIDFSLNESASVSLVSAYHQDLFSDSGLIPLSKYLNHMPWRAVKAGLVSVKSNIPGRRFSTALSSHILYSFIRNRLSVKWWLDQGVLFSLLSRLEEFGLSPKDFMFIKQLYPLELHTLTKAKELGDAKMSKELYFKLKLEEKK